MRSFLLGSVAALVAARPLVFGEDPGLTASPTDTGSLLFTFAWLLLALGFAVSCAAMRRSIGRLNAVEWALLAVTVLVFLGAERAPYRHAAKLIAWEWAGFLAAYALVRRAVAESTERNGLLTVLLASTVSVSAYGVYQRAVEFPRDERRYVRNSRELRIVLNDQKPGSGTDATYLRLFRRGLIQARVFATYCQPDTFAGVLTLCLPAMLASAWLGLRRLAWWQAVLLAAAATVCLAALWLTRSLAAQVALASSLAIAVVFWNRRWLATHKIAALAGLTLLMASTWGALRTDLLPAELTESVRASVKLREDCWRAVGRMLADKPWSGFGPGSFANAYPRYMLPTAATKLDGPLNFLLEMWTFAGVLAALALLFALGAALSSAARSAAQRSEPQSTEAGKPAPAGAVDAAPAMGARIQFFLVGLANSVFFLGGVAGLAIGLALRIGEMPPEAVVDQLLAALGRSVVWLVAFGVLSLLPWTDRLRKLTLLTGVIALILLVCVSEGFFFPALAAPFWVVLALASDPPAVKTRDTSVVALAPAGALAAVCLYYGLAVFYPVTAGARAAAAADDAGRVYRDKLQNEWKVAHGTVRRVEPEKPAAFIRAEILPHFERALAADPGNAALHMQRAGWYMNLWTHDNLNDSARKSALQDAAAAEKLNPAGPEPYQTRHSLHSFVAQGIEDSAAQSQANQHLKDAARHTFALAAEALVPQVRLDPNNPQLRYQRAESLFRAGDADNGQREAHKADELDRLAGEDSLRSLSAEQRHQLRKWLKTSQ